MSITSKFVRCLRVAPSRKGAMLVLVAVTLVIFFITAAFSVDMAYMFLAREQLHIATDAAAKAAVVGLSQGNNQATATQKAINYAAANNVCGSPLTITSANVSLGKVAYAANGQWAFDANGTPKTAAQVTAQKTVSLFFAPVIGTNSFAPTKSSTAAFVRNKWCFVFDRSGSMIFDMSGTDWTYPSPIGYHPSNFPHTSSPYPPSIYTPSATASRLANLRSGATVFLTELTNSPGGTSQNQVGMVTFGASGSTDCSFSSNYTPITNKLSAYISTDIWQSGIANAGTNMLDGLNDAVQLFVSSDDGTPWNKIIIVFSDGNWNSGTGNTQPSSSNPLNMVSSANSNHITIHTVGLFTNNTTMQQLASQTGGQYFYVTTGADLQAAFKKLAQTIPVILTQ
jgi:Ca-activated chloride channel homolog